MRILSHCENSNNLIEESPVDVHLLSQCAHGESGC